MLVKVPVRLLIRLIETLVTPEDDHEMLWIDPSVHVSPLPGEVTITYWSGMMLKVLL